MNGWIIDLRHTLRALRGRPVFAAVVVLTLGLGLGVNTAFFGVVEAVLLRPLPFADPERIVVLGESTPSMDTDFVSPVTFADWNDQGGFVHRFETPSIPGAPPAPTAREPAGCPTRDRVPRPRR
jgi:hypothetical protein